MKISLCLPETNADYIRHARKKALQEAGDIIRPGALEPIPFAMYLIAYRSDQRPVGMLEFTLYDQIYESFKESPYLASFGLENFSPFESFGGTRTIYVEPEARLRLPPLYLLLAIAGCKLGLDLGAKYTTVSTDVNNDYLMKLYRKTGGQLVGTFKVPEQSSFEIAVFVFEIEEIANHPAMSRLEDCLEIDADIVRRIRTRNRWEGSRLEMPSRHRPSELVGGQSGVDSGNH